MKLIDAIRTDNAEEVTKALKKLKNINRDLPNGMAPIFEAAEAGATKVIPILLDAGAEPRFYNLPLGSALARAAEHGHVAAVELLLKRVKWSREELDAAAWKAGLYGRVEVLPLLKAAGADMREAAARAVDNAMTDAVRWFLANGVDANARVPDKRSGPRATRTLLHVAAHGAAAASVPLLLAAGAEVDARDSRGRTPLMVAAADEPGTLASNLSALDRLAEAKRHGQQAMSAAEKSAKVDFTVFDALLEAGADPKAVDEDGNGAMQLFLAENERTLKAKLAKDDDAYYRLQWNLVRHVHRRLTALGAGGGAKADAKQALFEAIRAKDLKGVKAALANGADASSRDTGGLTPLGLAALKGDVDVVRALLDAGADVNDGGSNIRPANKAAHLGHLDALKLLVERGADVNLIDPDDEDQENQYNALAYAKVNDEDDVIAYLKSIGARMPQIEFKPFTPGVELPDSFVEAFVKAPAHDVARAVAEAIGGKATPDAWEKTLKAGKRSYAVVRLEGSEWSSVLGVTGATNQIDKAWEKLCADVSKLAGAPALLIEHEDVSGHTGYRMYENGKSVEHFEAGDEDLYREARDAGVKVKRSLKTGTFRSKRGKTMSAEERQDVSLHTLAEAEGFRTLNYGPGAEKGKSFDFEILNLPYKVAEAAYATT